MKQRGSTEQRLWIGRMLPGGLAIGLAWALAGCGYHFPGDAPTTTLKWQQATIQVESTDRFNDPAMAEKLRNLLNHKLGVTGRESSGGHRLQVQLFNRTDQVVTVSRAGKTGKNQLMIEALPILIRDGTPVKPPLTRVMGSAFYEEGPLSPLQIRSNRVSAEAEAMERLADALVALVTTELP